MEEEYIFDITYKEALKAFKKNEIPVGSVIVNDENRIIAKSHNDRQCKHNILGHAEINTIIKAEKKIKDWRLDKCTLYVTLHPCEMCQSVIKESRIKKVVYLLDNKNVKNNSNYYKTNVCNNIKIKYEKLLNKFFENLRK